MFRIFTLAEHPEFIPTLAFWFKSEWPDYYHDRTAESIEEDFRERANRDAIPIAYVAVDDGELIGTMALAAESITTHPHLSPWLCALYVLPDHRKRGVGTALLQAGMEDAKRLGYDELYAGTAVAEAMLLRLGWETLEVGPYHGEQLAVMCYRFSDGVDR